MTLTLQIDPKLATSAIPLLRKLTEHRFASRLYAHDVSLWGAEAQHEASSRLGWLHPFAAAESIIHEAESLRDELRLQGIDQFVLCGMGGSSLGPEVIAREAGAPLTVLDATHPEEVLRALGRDLSRTAVVVASKSGSTVETTSHAAAFRRAFEEVGVDPVTRMIYVTDPGSSFAQMRNQGYRVFLADPNVGGRFSALTAFGIVPTVLAGADARRLMAQAQGIHEMLALDTGANPAMQLASVLASGLPDRFVLLLQEAANTSWGLGDWVEQLVAESTGKQGKGLLPISLPLGSYELSTPPANSLVVHLGPGAGEQCDLALDAPLGAQLLLWEVATAALGHLMGINPFDQPDVEAAKVAARNALNEATGIEAFEPLDSEEGETLLVKELRKAVPAGGYLSIQAYIDRQSSEATAARALRDRLAKSLGVPVSLGWGPRYLHSVGQLHKGGPALGVYLQLFAQSATECAIPGSPNGFGALLHAQARGDRAVLNERGRTVLVRAL